MVSGRRHPPGQPRKNAFETSSANASKSHVNVAGATGQLKLNAIKSAAAHKSSSSPSTAASTSSKRRVISLKSKGATVTVVRHVDAANTHQDDESWGNVLVRWLSSTRDRQAILSRLGSRLSCTVGYNATSTSGTDNNVLPLDGLKAEYFDICLGALSRACDLVETWRQTGQPSSSSSHRLDEIDALVEVAEAAIPFVFPIPHGTMTGTCDGMAAPVYSCFDLRRRHSDVCRIKLFYDSWKSTAVFRQYRADTMSGMLTDSSGVALRSILLRRWETRGVASDEKDRSDALRIQKVSLIESLPVVSGYALYPMHDASAKIVSKCIRALEASASLPVHLLTSDVDSNVTSLNATSSECSKQWGETATFQTPNFLLRFEVGCEWSVALHCAMEKCALLGLPPFLRSIKRGGLSSAVLPQPHSNGSMSVPNIIPLRDETSWNSGRTVSLYPTTEHLSAEHFDITRSVADVSNVDSEIRTKIFDSASILFVCVAGDTDVMSLLLTEYVANFSQRLVADFLTAAPVSNLRCSAPLSSVLSLIAAQVARDAASAIRDATEPQPAVLPLWLPGSCGASGRTPVGVPAAASLAIIFGVVRRTHSFSEVEEPLGVSEFAQRYALYLAGAMELVQDS